MKRAQSGLCASNTSENQAGSPAAVHNSWPSVAGQRTVTPGREDTHFQSHLEMVLSSNLPNALLLCALRPKFSTWGVFVLLKGKCQMKISSSLSGLQNWGNSWAKHLGQGVLPLFAPFSTAFHICWVYFPGWTPCSHLVSCHHDEQSREQLMGILMISCPVTLELKQICISNMPKTLRYMEVIQSQICLCSLRQIWRLGWRPLRSSSLTSHKHLTKNPCLEVRVLWLN